MRKQCTYNMQDQQLYEKHVRTVYGFFMAKTFHKPTAEDLTSEVFTTAYEQFANPARHVQDKEKYLYGIMKNVWLRYLRNKYTQLEDPSESVQDFAVYAEQELKATKERSLIDRALPYINQLPKSQRAVLLLRFKDGLSLAEIAKELNKNMNYVKTTQRRGLATLKRVIARSEI